LDRFGSLSKVLLVRQAKRILKTEELGKNRNNLVANKFVIVNDFTLEIFNWISILVIGV